MQDVGLQTQSCGCSPLRIESEKNCDKYWLEHRGWRLCDKHHKALGLCVSCEFNELEDNKTAQMTEWMDMKVSILMNNFLSVIRYSVSTTEELLDRKVAAPV
jgi:hypothetical protein